MQGLADKLGEQEWSLLAHRPGKNDSNADSLTHIKPELPSAQRHSAQENTSVSIRVGNTSSQKSEPEVSRATLVGKNSTKFSFQTNETKICQHSRPMYEKMAAVGINPGQMEKENISEDVYKLPLISYCQHEEFIQQGGASQCKRYLNSFVKDVRTL